MVILLISEDGKSNRKQKRFQNHSEAFANYQRTQRKVENHTQAFAEYQELVNAGFTVDICVNIEKGDK